MKEYKFNFKRFTKLFGKRCPCLIPNKDNPEKDRCPCEEFRHTGNCRCKLFNLIE